MHACRSTLEDPTFLADPEHRHFAGDLSVAATARIVAQGQGERGRNVDYLSYTLAHMHELGVKDPRLDRVLFATLALRNGKRLRARS